MKLRAPAASLGLAGVSPFAFFAGAPPAGALDTPPSDTPHFVHLRTCARGEGDGVGAERAHAAGRGAHLANLKTCLPPFGHSPTGLAAAAPSPSPHFEHLPNFQV